MNNNTIKKAARRIISIIISIVLSCTTTLPAYALTDSNNNMPNSAYKSTSEPTIWNGTTATSFHSGTGTQTDPYVISNGEELSYLAYDINNGNGLRYKGCYFILSDDIYLNDVSDSEWFEKSYINEWTPIGNFKQWGNMMYGSNNDMKYEFTGIFDGNGHTIYGLYINTSEDCCGLFGSTEQSQISNLKISNSYISGNNCVGSVVGNQFWGSKITNCESNAYVSGNNQIGGIVGRDRCGTYSYLCNKGKIVGNDNVSGLVGEIYIGYAIIEKSYNSGEIIGKTCAGGIVGRIQNNDNSRTYVKNCYNEGSVRATGDYVYLGGIVGDLCANRIISYCYNIGKISADNNGRIGGIVGNREPMTGFSDCYYLDTSADTDIGIGGIFNPNSYNRKTSDELKNIGATWEEKNPSVWFVGSGINGFNFAKLIFPQSIKYAKLLVYDAESGSSITDYEVKLEDDSGLAFIPNLDEYYDGQYIVGTEDSFNKKTNILIKKDDYYIFSCTSNTLNSSYDLYSPGINIISLSPKYYSESKDASKKQAFISEHVEFARCRHDLNVSKKGFENAYWKFDDGDEFFLSTLGNWIGNVNEFLNFNIDDINFSCDYYDMFLSDMILTMLNTEKINGMDLDVLSYYHKAFSKITTNWGEKLMDLDKCKNTIMNAEELQKWNIVTENVEWNKLQEELEKLMQNDKNTLSKPTEKFLKYISSKDFADSHHDFMASVFEGMEIADEVCKTLSSASGSIKEFQQTLQAYVAAKTLKDVYSEFFTILDKTVEELNKEDPEKASKFESAVNKYRDIAINDNALYSSCLNQILDFALDFSYDNFIKDLIKDTSLSVIQYALGIKNANLLLEIISASYNIGYSIGDYITGISDKSENYTLMYYIAPVEKALEKVSAQYKDTLINTYDTYSNTVSYSDKLEKVYSDAENYDCSYRMLRNINMYLYNCLYKIGTSGQAIDIGNLHLGQAHELVDFSAGYLYFWNKNMCHGNASVISNQYKITSIQCPVDVYVYSEAGDLIVSIVDENVVNYNPEITILVNNGKKTIIYPKDNSYKIKIISRTTGTMNYYVSEISDESIRNIEFYDIPLSEGQEYEGMIVSDFSVPTATYELRSGMNTITSDYDSNTTVNHLNTPVGLVWNNTTVSCSEVSGAAKYNFYLYKNGQLYIKTSSFNNYFDASKYIKETGDYTFSVVAVGSGIYADSKRSETSRIYAYIHTGTSITDSNNLSDTHYEGLTEYENGSDIAYINNSTNLIENDTEKNISELSPNTVDNNNVRLWFIILCVCLLSIIGSILYNKSSRRDYQ